MDHSGFCSCFRSFCLLLLVFIAGRAVWTRAAAVKLFQICFLLLMPALLFRGAAGLVTLFTLAPVHSLVPLTRATLALELAVAHEPIRRTFATKRLKNSSRLNFRLSQKRHMCKLVS